jgi:hypothetical protein
MLHHVLLAKLKSDLPDDAVEQLMVESRIRLLKIPEVMNLRCGKRLDAKKTPYEFFLAMDVENTAKLRVIYESAIYLQFKQQILDTKTSEISEMSFEMEPGKDVIYS